jgi:hypothetical protein
MEIPLHLELVTVLVYLLQKESMKKPQVSWVFAVKAVQTPESGEESAPASSELCSYFYPKSFNPCVASRSTQESVLIRCLVAPTLTSPT